MFDIFNKRRLRDIVDMEAARNLVQKLLDEEIAQSFAAAYEAARAMADAYHENQ